MVNISSIWRKQYRNYLRKNPQIAKKIKVVVSEIVARDTTQGFPDTDCYDRCCKTARWWLARKADIDFVEGLT